MPQFSLNRAGALINRWIPDSVPLELDSYAWPKSVADKLKASDAALIAIDEAAQEHETAEHTLHVEAPQKDTEALRTALRAGKGDPGTPHTDAARRAEEVSWQALEMVIDDAKAPMQAAIDAVAEYVKAHTDKIAAYELARWDEAVTAKRAADEAAIAAENARRAVGSVYVHARWFSGEIFAPEPFQVIGNDFNSPSALEVRSRYEARRDGVEDKTGVQTGRLGSFDSAGV